MRVTDGGYVRIALPALIYLSTFLLLKTIFFKDQAIYTSNKPRLIKGERRIQVGNIGIRIPVIAYYYKKYLFLNIYIV
jgi:hypothetical protein